MISLHIARSPVFLVSPAYWSIFALCSFVYRFFLGALIEKPVQVTADQLVADEQQEIVEKDVEEANKVAANVQIIKDDCQKV